MNRKTVACKIVEVGVHEWGGYPMVRQKAIKQGATFTCGLQGQLNRFENHPDVRLTVTMSEAERHTCVEQIRQRVCNFIEVSNQGMDFAGYSAFYDTIKDKPNAYVILTNSSVNAIDHPFLDNYIHYMESNKDVGLLGVSYCTKMIQTLVRKNFTPHLQSFFLLTTTDVLRQVVERNNGKFPGVGIDHKLLLIRCGEIRMSKLVEQLGYRLAVINPLDGKPYKFTSYKKWKLPFGDIRQKIENPNTITPITL